MGSDVRLLIGDPLLCRSVSAARGGRPRARLRAGLRATACRGFARTATCRRSTATRDDRVPARAAAARGGQRRLWAAERSGGLVDPTLVPSTRAHAATTTRSTACEPASLEEALAHAPPRRAARPDPVEPWQEVDRRRSGRNDHPPAGVMIDTGGTGKGLCADAVAYRLGWLQPVRRRLRRRHRRGRRRRRSSSRTRSRSSIR